MSQMYVCNKRISDISWKCEIRKHEPFIREKKKYGRKFSVLIVFEITQRNESVAWEVDAVCEVKFTCLHEENWQMFIFDYKARNDQSQKLIHHV